MFTIVISEKGGAERREAFERTEVSVGRVQGNDLMLPKGNVSKHHARLIFRDSRFIVTDLKSTNGTYVNGQKIAQATIVREGDKIYIGDFVLRLEGAQALSSAESARDSSRDATGALSRAAFTSSHDATAPAPGGPTPAPAPSVSASMAPPSPIAGMSVPAPRPGDPASVSHYPLERDPDSESAPELKGAAVPRVPGPPRLPQAPEMRPRPFPAPPPEPVGSVPPPRAKGPSLPSLRPVDRSAPRETPQQAARKLALIALVDRVADVIDVAALDAAEIGPDEVERVERAVQQQVSAMRAEGESPAGVDLEKLARDAVRELVGLGPIEVYLRDEEVNEIHVARADSVSVTKAAGAAMPIEPSFTSDQALARVVARLVRSSGVALVPGRSSTKEEGEKSTKVEGVLERQLPSGARLVAIGPPLARAWSLKIRKPRRIESSLDELVRAGALSRAMALFLETCVGARANLLVVGPGASAVGTILAALGGAAAVGDRIMVLQEHDEIAIPNAQTTAVAVGNVADDAALECLVRASAQLASDRWLIVSLAGVLAAAVLDAIAKGGEGVIAGLDAPSLRQGLGRLVAHVALTRGAAVEAVREVAAESFEVAIEIRRTSDGKLRFGRIAELAGVDAKGIVTHDIFVANPEAGGEVSFAVTGTVPRLTHDLAARGIRLDPAIFRKARGL